MRGLLQLWSRRSALAAAGATVGSATFALCDAGSVKKVPPFVLGGDRYDQTKFEGRLAKIQEMIDLRTAFTSDEDLARCQARLAEFKKLGALPAGTTAPGSVAQATLRAPAPARDRTDHDAAAKLKMLSWLASGERGGE